ncbi:MAG TPA: hypothetical protein ENK86_05515 [Campylobacterales bacterium]|nr:hypothetical protein [Campylobacterales bacterium]
MHPELRGWVEFLGIEAPVLTLVHGNQESRRYYRIENKTKKFMVVDASHCKESVPTFIGIALRLKETEVRTPRVRSFELHKGFMLQDDIGSMHLIDTCASSNPATYYDKAIATLVEMQKAPTVELSAIEVGDLIDEMNLMVEWYLKKHLGKTIECVEGRILLEGFMQIAKEVMAQPQETFVHRDYHSKNLMIESGDAIVVMDFQDACQGPLTYDLVSLLRDAYVSLDYRERKRLMMLYRELKGIEVDEMTFLRWCDFTSMQRNMKLLGAFAQQHHEGGKEGFIEYTPLLVQYILDAASNYPELEGLVSMLTPEESDSEGFFL